MVKKLAPQQTPLTSLKSNLLAVINEDPQKFRNLWQHNVIQDV